MTCAYIPVRVLLPACLSLRSCHVVCCMYVSSSTRSCGSCVDRYVTSSTRSCGSFVHILPRICWHVVTHVLAHVVVASGCSHLWVLRCVPIYEEEDACVSYEDEEEEICGSCDVCLYIHVLYMYVFIIYICIYAICVLISIYLYICIYYICIYVCVFVCVCVSDCL